MKSRLLDQAFADLVDLFNSELLTRVELSILFEELVMWFAVVYDGTKFMKDHNRPAEMITRLAAKMIEDGHNSLASDVTTKS